MILHQVIFPGATNPVKVLKDLNVGSDEGRAMLQIIHDIAPKAGLRFQNWFYKCLRLCAVGIEELVNDGCNVIVDDITYYGQPFFRDGVVAKAVDAAAANGVAYFSSAGNFSNKAYDGTFNTFLLLPVLPALIQMR